MILLTKALLFFALLFGFVSRETNREAPLVTPITPIEQVSTSTSSQTTSIETTTTPKVAVKPAIKSAQPATSKATSTPPTIQQTPPQTTTPPASSISFETINENTRKAVVNILCTTDSSGPVAPITGSGVVISKNGVILTNAHIAQYFLLKDFNGQKDFMKCVIRTGNPAYPTYRAELVYISTQWVAEHKNDITLSNPQGTGEYDYAFLRITGNIDGSPLPPEFPFIPMNTEDTVDVGTNALIASYPAGFLGGQTIIQNLYQSSALIRVSDRYTFSENTIDLISLGSSVVAQKGSSGGAVVDTQGTLLGIISTSSDGDTTQSRNLRAITSGYIRRSFASGTDTNISSLITSSATYATTFNTDVAPILTKALTDAILKK